MKKSSIKSVSLADAKAMQARGEVFHDPNAPVGESLGREFWAKAQIVEPNGPMPVLLKIDPEVFEFFKNQGKGHLTRMQNVLRAYVDAHRSQR